MSATMPGRWPRLILPAVATLLGATLFANAGQAQTATLSVDATVVGQCSISSATLSFGNYGQGQSTDKDAQTSFTTTCPAGLNITIEFGPGSNPGGSTRAMSNGSDHLFYELYRDSARTQVWSTGANGKVIASTPATQQTHEVYGRIPFGQAPGPSSAYDDSVVMSFVIN